MHVRPVAEIASRTEIHVAERLEVRDPARSERSLLSRRETEEQLSVIGNQVRAVDPGGLCHSLRQARSGEKVATNEATPNARRVQDGRAEEQPTLAIFDVRASVAAQQHGGVVGFGG